MAKRKKYTPESAESSFDAAFDAAIEVAQKKFPDHIYTGGEESMRCICLPVPALAPRVFLQQEGWPLGRFCLLDGKQESCKSAFGYEVIRWHRKAKGKGQVIEVEDKKAPELCLSINNYDAKAWNTAYCETMQDWHAALTYWIQESINIMDGCRGKAGEKAKPGIGRIAPMCFLVDSIMAAVGEDIMEDVKKEGHGKRHFAGDTGLLSEFLKIFTKWLPGYPFSVIGVNHLKPTQDARGWAVRNMPGGKAPGYHATLDIEMQKLKEETRAKDQYIRLRMEMKKNSSAPKSSVDVDMVWYIDMDHPTEDGECLQRTYFDWNAASIDCMLDVIKDGGQDRKKRLMDLLEPNFSIEKRTFSSPTIGISEDSPLSWTEAGAVLEDRIQSDKSFRDALYPIMGVRRRHLFQTLVDYQEQMQQAKADAARNQALREAVVRGQDKLVKAAPVEGIPDFDEEDESPFDKE